MLPPHGQSIPVDTHHGHFGSGRTGTVLHLHLAPGTHAWQLEFGDANHVPFEPPAVSKEITMHVK